MKLKPYDLMAREFLKTVLNEIFNFPKTGLLKLLHNWEQYILLQYDFNDRILTGSEQYMYLKHVIIMLPLVYTPLICLLISMPSFISSDSIKNNVFVIFCNSNGIYIYIIQEHVDHFSVWVNTHDSACLS